ncbi:MAG: HAD domain-containing protein [Dehalococcoidia bacterium]|jgi:hypothetical protein
MNSNWHIFLDIDGVLATTMQYYSNPKKWNPLYNRYRFDEKCVKVFNQIIEKTNPVVILSSDWGRDYTLEKLNLIFEINGVNCTITDVTPNFWDVKYFDIKTQLAVCRADEIKSYTIDHNITKFLAIDDVDLSPWLPDNFVRTRVANEGIKQSGVKDKILKMLLS